jgi:uncharacterized protein
MAKTKKRSGITDFHVHIQPWQMFKPDALEKMKKRRPDLDDVIRFTQHPKDFLKHLDACGIERVACINYVSPDVMGFTDEVNPWIAKYCAEAPGRLLSVGSLHPRLVSNAESEMERLCGDLKIRMFKVHPAHQLVYPNEYRDGLQALGTIYRKLQEYRVPVMIHTGTSIFTGARNKYTQPIHCDDIGVDFPDLRVVLAHAGRPLWMDECFFLVRRFENFYIDVSGIPMKKLLDYVPRLEEIADKVLYGSDWPGPGVPTLKQNLEDFESLPISEAAKQKILVTNAQKLLP